MEHKDLDVESLENRGWICTEIQEVLIQMDISGGHSINNGKEYSGDTNGRWWIFSQVSKST
jgi:hypothetical protein